MSGSGPAQNRVAALALLATFSFGASARTGADEPTPLPLIVPQVVPQAEYFPAPVEFGTATAQPAQPVERDASRVHEIEAALAQVKEKFAEDQSDPERWTLRPREYQRLWGSLATAAGVSDQQQRACRNTVEVAQLMADHGVYVIVERTKPNDPTANYVVQGLALLIDPHVSAELGHTVLKPAQVVTVVPFDRAVAQLRDVAGTGVVLLREGPVEDSTVDTGPVRRAPFNTQPERTPEQNAILDLAYQAGYQRIDFSNITKGFFLDEHRYHVRRSDVFRTVTNTYSDGSIGENVGAEVQVLNMVPVCHPLAPGETFIAVRGRYGIVRFRPVEAERISAAESE
jgi:hypothetical protein